MEYNGGSIVAMSGRECVAIASDKRLGSRFTTISNNFAKLFEITPLTTIGLAGLATDVQSLYSVLISILGLKLSNTRAITTSSKKGGKSRQEH